MITRRYLLGGSGAVVALVAANATAMPALAAVRRRIVQRVIYHYVPDIVFDDDDLTAFADYVNGTLLSRQEGGLRRLIRYSVKSMVIHSGGPQKSTPPSPFMEEIDREIVSLFFLCTDFWQGPHRPGQRITLVRPPDPYEAGCSNPLAMLA